MKKARLDFGLVGAGAIAQAYARVFAESESTRLIAVSDTRLDAAKALAEPNGCRAYISHQDLLEKETCDAVLVCTPPASHTAVCLDVLGCRVPVLCEKPLSIDLASAQQMLEAAEAAGVILTMASKYRHVEDVIRAKSLVASGTLGEIVMLENSFASRVDMSSRWNSNPEISGGGVLIDNGTHSVDLVRYLLGPIAEVLAVECKRVQELPVEDTVRLLARSETGVVAAVDLSWSLNKKLASFLEIHGSRGTLQVGWRTSRCRRAGSSDWEVLGNGYRKLDALRRQVENFCDAARGTAPLLMNSDDAIASVQVIAAAYESMRRQKWMTVSQSGMSEAVEKVVAENE